MKYDNKDHVVAQWDQLKKHSRSKLLKREYPDLTKKIIEQTSFLDKKATLTQRFWHWRHDSYHRPVCKYCNEKEVNWDVAIQDYRIYCSKKCCNAYLAEEKSKNRYFHICKNPSCDQKVHRPSQFTCSIECWDQYKRTLEMSKDEMMERINEITDFSHSNLIKLSQDFSFANTIKKHLPENWPVNDQIGKQIRYFQGTYDPFRQEKWKKQQIKKHGDLPEYIKTKKQLTMYLQMLKSPECKAPDCTNQRERLSSRSVYSNFCSNQCKEKYHEYIKQRNYQRSIRQKKDPWNKNNDPRLNSKKWLEYMHYDKEVPKTEIARQLGGVYNQVITDRFKKFNIDQKSFNKSYSEDQLAQLVQECLPSHEIMLNSRQIIPPKEIDIYIPELNIAFEYCGLFWHCDKHERITPKYHYDKWKGCQQKGIRLITIFEDEWVISPSIVKSKIKTILGVNPDAKLGARKTIASLISKKDANVFFDSYHIQGSGPGSINIGLFNNEEMVAAATFINKKDHYILNRYATSINVQGGCGKIISHLLKHFSNKSIVSFSDNRWSDGEMYQKIGFKKGGEVKYDYYYFTPGTLHRYHKFSFRHEFLKNKLPKYDPSLSEVKNCANNDYYRIWNCGLTKWIYHVT